MSSKCMLINLLHSEQPRKDLQSQILKFSVHCILNVRAEKKRRKTSFVEANCQWSCYTLSQTYESHVTLSTLYFKQTNDYPLRISSHQYPVMINYDSQPKSVDLFFLVRID